MPATLIYSRFRNHRGEILRVSSLHGKPWLVLKVIYKFPATFLQPGKGMAVSSRKPARTGLPFLVRFKEATRLDGFSTRAWPGSPVSIQAVLSWAPASTSSMRITKHGPSQSHNPSPHCWHRASDLMASKDIHLLHARRPAITSQPLAN